MKIHRNSKNNKSKPGRKQKRSKIPGKIPVNIEYENNKQKMETLITERTDITPLLGMDWMKTFKLTIGRKQLPEINQSERDSYKQISGIVRKQRNDKTPK